MIIIESVIVIFLKYYKLHATHTQNEERSKHTCGSHDGTDKNQQITTCATVLYQASVLIAL